VFPADSLAGLGGAGEGPLREERDRGESDAHRELRIPAHHLIDGKFDIAMTAIDNLIAYREGQGEEPVLGRDLQAVMGGDTGFLRSSQCPR